MQNEQIRPYGLTVLGQWKRKGNVPATEYIKTVFVCTTITAYPPGKRLSIMYQQNRDVWTDTGRRAGKVSVALVGTDASVKECTEWAKTQNIIETINVSKLALDYFNKNKSKDKKQRVHVSSGTYEIDNELLLWQYEKQGRGLNDMAIEYNCTYHNLYNRIRRYKARNNIPHIQKQFGPKINPVQLIRQRDVEKLLYKDLAEIYKCTAPTIRNAYIREKKKLTDKV